MENLSVKAKQIYEILTSKATSQDKDGHFCIYPRKQLAIDCGVNEKTVRRTLNELEEKKYILRIWQDDRQAQKIYVLKNVHTSTERGNVHTSTMSGEKENLFLMIRQGFGLSAFTLQATSQKVEPNVDAFTGKATLEFKDIKVLIEEYSKHKNLTVPTMQLLDFMDIRLTERGMKSPSVEFTVDEYMQYRRLSDRKSIREQIQSAIEELKSISLEWEEKRGKRQIEYKFMNIADSGYVSRNGKITFTFGTTFFGVLKTYSVMSYPEQLGQINSRLNPNSYNFLRKISEHKNMNAGKKTKISYRWKHFFHVPMLCQVMTK